MMSSNENISRVTGPLCGEFTRHRWIPHTQRPVTRSFGVFLDLRLNKREAGDLGCHCAHYDFTVMEWYNNFDMKILLHNWKIWMPSEEYFIGYIRPHRVRMTYICVNKLSHRWVTQWRIAYSVPSYYLNQCYSIGPLGTNSSEIWIAVLIVPFTKMHLKMLSTKRWWF